MPELNSFKGDDMEHDALSGRARDEAGIRKASQRQKTFLYICLPVTIAVLLILLLISSGLTVYYARLASARTVRSPRSEIENLTSLLSSTSKNRVKDVRLPFTVVPLFYSLKLQANIYDIPAANFTFNGSVVIEILCYSQTDHFFVHAHGDLNVNTSHVKVYKKGETANRISSLTFDKSRQWFVIKLDEPLVEGQKYFVDFPQFRGPLTTNLKGWYLSSYMENGVEKYLATSQLQPTDARRVFPCWDEPSFKARFQITIVRRRDFRSLSNMPLMQSHEVWGDWIEDEYQPTVNTSTYLLAFVVSQFSSLSGLDSKGRNFTIWARPDLIGAAEYALNVGKCIINFFEEYFELDYPLNKTDMLAVPHFAAGAMENWGLLIYREATLIWDPVVGTEGARQKVATVISHEIAHQWFGNLVTLNWWDDLWLNEGFATFVEYIGVAHAQPDWHMDEQFAVLQLQKVLLSDSLATTHPVFMPVYHPDEINEIFDTISYNKGASILRMMEAFLGRETFRRGLKIYLARHKFKNTESIHLWDALTEANRDSGRDINIHQIMNCWIKQTGYPLVTVTRTGPKTFRLTQQRFLLGFELKNNSMLHIDNTWNIPLTYAAASEDVVAAENRIIWMNNASMDLELQIPEDEWYTFNLRQTGFYRVNYDDANWYRFIECLHSNHSVFTRLTRAQLIDDSFNIANQGSISFDLFLNLTKYLRNERDFVPLSVAYRAFNYLYEMLVLHETHDLMKKYVRTLINDTYSTVTWDIEKSNENHVLNLARQTIVTMACEAEHEDCVKKSRTLFEEFMQNPKTDVIPTSLSRTVYCTAIRWGGAKEWEFLHKLRKQVLHEDEKYRIIEALGCTRDFGRLRLFIRELIAEAEMEFPTSLSSSPIALYLLWDTIKGEWSNRTVSPALQMIFKAIDKRRIIIEALPIQNELREMYNSLKDDPERQTARSIARILVQCIRDKYWLSKYRKVIYNWLKRENL
ncbi:hypothetical protein AAHC03_05522 [Spirometra sp. Aus1]